MDADYEEGMDEYGGYGDEAVDNAQPVVEETDMSRCGGERRLYVHISLPKEKNL